MNEYVRPSVSERVYRDESGAVIEYGNRWGVGMPDAPSDSYSRTSNLDRFEPLHQVADALIAHLVSTYEVTATPVEMDDTNRNCSTLRAVRLTPAVENAASLLFRFTDYPSVEVNAGLSRYVVYPDCSCDACDETWESCAEDIEDLVFAVAAGGFNEEIELSTKWNVPGKKGSLGYKIDDPARDVFHASANSVEVTDELRETAALLDARPDCRWQPWRRR